VETKKTVLLIALPTMGKWTPLNLMCLAGMLDRHGIDCTIVDTNIVGERGVRAEIDRGYGIVGLSVMSPARWVAFDTATLIRRRSPRSLIVMGGVHATLMPEQVQKHCDVVIKGDGEAPFLDLCQGKEPIERFLPIDDLPPNMTFGKLTEWQSGGNREFPCRPRDPADLTVRFVRRFMFRANTGCVTPPEWWMIWSEFGQVTELGISISTTIPSIWTRKEV
jgi:hypothetical protein